MDSLSLKEKKDLVVEEAMLLTPPKIVWDLSKKPDKLPLYWVKKGGYTNFKKCWEDKDDGIKTFLKA